MENRDRGLMTAAGRENLGRRTFLKVTGAGAAATGLAVILDSRWSLAQTTSDPAVVGEWSSTVDLPIVAIHTHLLPNGNVLAWGRREEPARPSLGAEAAVWDPTLASPRYHGVHNPYVDIYCTGHAFLADGRLLVAGGHVDPDFVGSNVTSIFDSRLVNPSTKTAGWSRGPDMQAGRWYPTVTTLGNGDVLVVSGTITTEGQVNRIPEILTAATGWQALPDAALSLPLYPWMHLASDGRVFCSGPEGTTRYLDTTGRGRWTPGPSTKVGDRHQYEGTSVMYEPGKVLIVGGGNSPFTSAEVIDVNDTSPRWQDTDPMTFPRRYLNATILPDGKVLVTGGSSSPHFNDPAGAVYQAEMWDPATGRWSMLAAMRTPRMYHSTALLLPDGRALVAGGNRPGPDIGRYNAEYYSPPYLFKGDRPRITSISSAQEIIGYGETFRVDTPDAADIGMVTLVRLSSVTHEFNQNQRFNRLAFAGTEAGTGLSVTVPSDPNICPPGHYMLFLLNRAGVPSIAKITRIGAINWTTDEASDSQVSTVPPRRTDRRPRPRARW
jgi:hypothetical protein